MATKRALRRRTERVGSQADVAYVLPALVASAVVYVLYLATHPLPAYGAGLFLEMADAVSRHGYRLPETVAGYTERGVPFVYPPLAIYGLAALQDVTGADGLTVARFLPGLVSTLAVVPTYLLSREVLDTRLQASLSTVLAATSPPVLQWHLSAGGVVRAPAYLFLLSGLYVGVRLFGRRERSLLWPAAALFGVTVLTHPLYATAFGISYLWLYVALDRSARGLLDGATVAGGGLAVASPWLAVVEANHGIGSLAAAAGTHGGIGGRVMAVLSGDGVSSVLFSSITESANAPGGQVLLWFWLGLVVAAFAYTLLARGPLLPGWFLVLGVTVWKARFGFLLGAMVLSFAATDGVRRLVGFARRVVSGRPSVGTSPGPVVVVPVLVLAVAGTAAGGAYAAGALETHPGNPSQPQYADAADVEAMQAVPGYADPDATFVVLGDAAEWFPYLADRTILTGHWGVEWRGADAFTRQYGLHRQLSRCPSADCVTELLAERGLAPDYVYVPTAEYTVNGVAYDPPADRVASFRDDQRYDPVYRNEGVTVFEVDRPPSADGVADSS